MASLVDGYGVLLLACHHLRLLLQSAYDAVDGVVEIFHVDLRLAIAGSDEGRLVADVGDIGTAEARCLPGEFGDVELIGELQRLEVDAEYLDTVVELRQVDVNLAVEASGAQQGTVQDVGAVGRGEDDDAAVRAEAVHLREELVERVLALVV